MLNKSYSYLLPLFNEECPINDNYFIMLNNVYTRYNDNLDHFILCYENSDNALFKNYIERLHENYLFVESFNEDTYLYIVFDFPEEYKYEYNCYLNGRFSKFREESKKIILEYILYIHKLEASQKIKKVLYKDIILKQHLEKQLNMVISDKLELSSIPSIEAETCYNINKCTQE